MKISFDLDGTIIPFEENDFPLEKRSFIHKIFNIERIRRGTKKIFKELKKENHKIGIYTTSLRSKRKIRFQFFSYGINPDFIINGDSNHKMLNKRNLSCSKFPPAFKVDIHIDDSEGVAIESKTYGFKSVIIKKEIINWENYILSKILENK